ncbi:ribonucleotide reductase, all-alpha domain protein, partial [Gardnerella vaginalis JCP7672]|uniref:ribonucleotide reductase N-terminal alpha domain-containing protein n=1 Tax=Gardnerella vaginalis TaxID=2702 RepID=UPI000353C9B3
MNSTDPMSESTSLNLDHTDADGTTASSTAERIRNSRDYHVLNAMLGLFDPEKGIQFDKDQEAEKLYVSGYVQEHSMKFASTHERLNYLISNYYYNGNVFSKYSSEFLDKFYEHAESAHHTFGTFLGAFKFYTSYALKTFDGKQYLENFAQRAAAVALELADGDEKAALNYLDEMLAGRFQPATPTFLNLG